MNLEDISFNTNDDYNVNINNYNLEFFKLLITNQIEIFNKENEYEDEYLYENVNNELKINKRKETLLVNKIIDNQKKYKYFKYKIHNNDKNIYKIFINSQKIYFFFLNFINKKIKENQLFIIMKI